MAGGLGGLGGILGAIGQSLLTSPRENPFQGLPTALQSVSKMSEHQAALSAMSTVAEKLGVPKELAASPEAMKLFIDHINATKLNQLRQQAAQGGTFTPPEDTPTSQPAMSVPGLQGSSGIPTTFNVAGGVGASDSSSGGLGGLGGMAGGAAPSFAAGAGGAPRTMTSPGASLSGPRAEKGRAVFSGLVERGLSPIAAAAVTGNLDHESGGFNTKALGDEGTAFGLAQWRLDRLNALKRLAAQQGKPASDMNVQLDHLMNELKGPYRGTLTALNAARSPQEGALAFMRGFERPSAKELVKSAPPRASSAANAFRLYGGGGGGGPSQAPSQAVAGDVPLPPARPIQLASNDANMPLPSTAMQRVMDEARARGIGQGGPDTGQAGAGIGQGGPGIGQSGAPLNQVAAGRGRALSVPIPPQTNIPAAPATPTAPPPVGTGDTRTKAAARAEFQRGMNILAASNGDPVLMKQAEIIMQSARKYLEPSDVARRVSEAGLMGTPVGRAIIGGLPQSAVEALTEQQIPGYVSPSTLEQKKYRSAEEERAYQHSKAEHEARIAEAQRQYQNQFGERKFSNEVGQQQYQNQFGERKFANEIGQQTLDYNLRTKAAELEQNKFNYDRYKTDRAYQQQVDQAVQTTTTKDYDAYARQELEQGRTPKSRIDYSIALARAGSPQPEGVEDVERAKGVTAFLNKQAERAPGLAQRSADLDLLNRVINKTATGKGANLRATLDAFGAELGMSSGTIASQKDLIDSITNRIAPSLREPGSGSQSDAELRGFLSAMPHMAGQPGGNELISSVLRRSSDIDNRRSDIAAKWQSGEMKAGEARTQIAALDRSSIYASPKERELVDRFMGNMPDQQTEPPPKKGNVNTIESLKDLPEGKYGRTENGNVYKKVNGKLVPWPSKE